MELKEDIVKKVLLLQQKYASMGQDLESYLDGLLYADYLTYWDYIHLDTLLSLQTPSTSFPDEEIFIIYHQITELYFKLTLHEMKQIAEKQDISVEFFTARLSRINSYFKALIDSFEIMVNGMEQEQFLKFRMSLLPASGFQSAQYRLIEIHATDFINLIDKDLRSKYPNEYSTNDLAQMYQDIYWKKGATELGTGKKTLTLKQFEKKYTELLLSTAHKCFNRNIRSVYTSLSENEKAEEKLIEQLKWLDVNVNINWPLSHYKSAVRYLQRNPIDIAATGGTNWQKYLPPRFQKRIFYPELWETAEIEDWGKGWVEEILNPGN
ncbi:MAG: tryptophan 2,3-dioxygenase family protein [Flavobacteriales bacterium]